MASFERTIYSLVTKAIIDRNYEALEFLHKSVHILYDKRLLNELVKSQDERPLRIVGDTIGITTTILQKDLIDELVEFYISTHYSPSSMEFSRHQFLDILLAYKLIDISSFANRYMCALKNTLYWNCNADVIYHITLYITEYNHVLFTLDMVNRYCELFNWKMIALAFIYKTRVFSHVLYNQIEHKLCIIELMKTITELDVYNDETQLKMSNMVMKTLNKELDALLKV